MPREIGLVVLVAVVLAACGGTPDPVASPGPLPTATTPASPSPSPSPTDDAVVVAITVADGNVEGGIARPEVQLGQTVRLEVTSDATDHVHVHGYDLFADVEAGGTAVLEFTADIPGQFEIELEDQHFKIAELVVRG